MLWTSQTSSPNLTYSNSVFHPGYHPPVFGASRIGTSPPGSSSTRGLSQIARNCSVNALDLQRKSPLFHAASCDNLASARLLLKAGALPNHGEGDSALLRAVTRDNKPMVELLLAAGARDDGAYRKVLVVLS